MSNNAIPIRSSAFSQSHPRVANTNSQYNNSFTQINHSHNHNHNHNHNHHHVHYNNSLHPKVTPTALPVIIQSKTVKQTTTTITQPFSSNKNNIPPLKTRSHSRNVNAPPIATAPHPSNIYRNNPSIQSLRHTPHPHPRLIPSRVPRSYPAVTPPNFMPYQTRTPQQQNPNIYNKYHHHNANQPAHHPQNMPSNANNVSFPKEHHFKAPAASNFVHQSQTQSQSHISSRESLFGNVIIDGPVKAPSPIGLETIVSSVPSINSQETSNSPASHAFISHANSQRMTKAPFSYQANHLTHVNTTRKRKRLSECINPMKMAPMPYNNTNNSVSNQRYNQSQGHYPQTQRHSLAPPQQQQPRTANVPSMMMQPPFKKRKVVNYGANTHAAQQFMNHTPQMMQQQVQSGVSHMNQSQMNGKHNQRNHNVIRQRQIQTNLYQTDNYGPAPFVNTGGGAPQNNSSISPPFAYTNHSVHSHQSHHSSTPNSINLNQSPLKSHNKLATNPNNPHAPRPLKPPTPTMCTQRRKKQSQKIPKRKKQTRKKAHKPAAKLCAEPRNFRLKPSQSSNYNQEDELSRIPKRKQRAPSPISHPELSAGQLAPALMPMPSISDKESESKNSSKQDLQSLPPLQPFPLYPQGPMMPPSPLGPMSVTMNGSPLSLNALPVMNGSPSNVAYSMHYTPGYNDSFNTYAYDSPSHNDNDYMVQDLKANISDIPMSHNSPFVISDDERNNNGNNGEQTLTHFVVDNEDKEVVQSDESTQSEEVRSMKPLRLSSVDLFDENDADEKRQYDELKKKQNELHTKLGWNEDSKIDREFVDSLPLFPVMMKKDDNNNTNNAVAQDDVKQLKKAAMTALYDVDAFELMDPEITRLRLTMDDALSDEDVEDHETNRDSLCLFTSSLIGSVYHDNSQPRTLSVPMKCYIAHNEYNLTHGMSKRLHDRWRIKMPQEKQEALRNKLLNEWNNDRHVSSYKLMINDDDDKKKKEDNKQKSDDDEGDEEREDGATETDRDCTWIHGGVVTDWNRIKSLGVSIPSYCLDPSNYTAQQLADPGCFKEKNVIQHPHFFDREIEINFFIYIPGGDIMGQLKTQSATYPPIAYEIGCEGTRQCTLCSAEEKECVGIIDLLNDRNDRIWACQQCKNAFRIGLKLNTRTKQYRLKDNHHNDGERDGDEMNVDKGDGDGGGDDNCNGNNNHNNNSNHNEKKKKKYNKYNKKRRVRKREKEGPFCETVRAFAPYIYNVDGKQYIFRYFEESDLDVLNHLDIKMTAQLLGTDADSYGKSWLHKLTNPQRKTHHIWRTVACAQLLDVADDDDDDNEDSNANNKYHMVPVANSPTTFRKKKESKPIAFAMYKHMKNDMCITKRYGELFWILVDNGHQRKGIASRLIDIMVNEAQREEKITEFRLHVLKNNDAAIPLYKKLAFTKKGSKQNYPKRNYESYRCVKML